MKRILIAGMLLSAVYAPLSARHLTVSEALASAGEKSILPIFRASRSGADFRLVHTEKSGLKSTVYVLNKEGGGFVILSADDIAAPVLGYSDSGSVDPSDIPANMQSWLEYYSGEISAAADAGSSAELQSELQYSNSPSSGEDFQPIAPLMKTIWGQGAPYNNTCPVLGSERCYAGCVATAVAQILRHHSWPVKGKGTWTYYWSAGNENITCDYENLTFQWDKMLDNYLIPGTGVIGTDEQQSAVADLTLAVAIGSNMKFSSSASAASAWNTARALIENFDYDKNLNYLERQYYTYEEWIAMVYGELAANCPVYYEGYNHAAGKGSGHAFVVDGYDKDGYFHLNWGWNGTSNGYFLLTALNPREQGIGGSTSGYNGNQAALFGVRRPTAGASLSHVFYATGNFTTDKSSFPRPEGIGESSEKVTFRFANGSAAGYLGLMCIPTTENNKGIQASPAVKLVSVEDGSVSYIDGDVATFRRGNVMSSYTIDLSKFTTPGSFEVTPAVRIGDRYDDIHVAVGKAKRLKLTVSTQSIMFSSDSETTALKIDDINLNGATAIVSGKACSISATISNSGAEFYGYIYPALYSKDSGARITRMSEIAVDIVKGATVTVEWNEAFFDTIETGDYLLSLTDAAGNRIGTGIEVAVNDGQPIRNILLINNCEFPNSAGTYEFTNNGMSATAARQYKTIRIKITLQCTSGSFTDAIVYAYVYGLDYSYHGDVGGQTISLAKGESTDISFSKDINKFFLNGTLKVGSLYKIQVVIYKDGTYSDPLKSAGGESDFYIYITNESSGLELIREDNGCTLYPNPAVSTVSISSDGLIREIAVYSMSGTLALERHFSGTGSSEQIDVTSLPSGYYLVRVMSDNGSSIVRLIKR